MTQDATPERSVFERILSQARADDAACALALAGFNEPELVGELMVAIYRCQTPAGRAAIAPLLAEPFARGRWQGFKRIYKLSEQLDDDATWAELTHVLDQSRWAPYPISNRTVAYLQRRSYRTLKRLAQEAPERFLELSAQLLVRAERGTPVLTRLLRLDELDATTHGGGFQVALENPFAAADEGEDEAAELALLDLDAEQLVARDEPQAGAAEGGAAAPAVSGALKPRAPAAAGWRGPIFSELWSATPERWLALLPEVKAVKPARALARLLRERVGERLLGQPLDAFYALLQHEVEDVWRLGLSELAARARRELLRFDELVPLFERAAGASPRWGVLADLLYVLDDDRADAARAGLGGALIGLARRHADEAQIAPVVTFVRRHFAEQLGPPLFDAESALDLLAARRADVRGLGRDALEGVCAKTALRSSEVAALLRTPLAEDEPEAVLALLSSGAVVPGGYRPPERLPLTELRALTEGLPQAGFRVLRRLLLRFEDEGGLDPSVGRTLAGLAEVRARGLGLELYGAALRRGALSPLDVVELLRAGYEDVVLWARERIREAAGDGRLPNEALYRMLDAVAADVRGFGRELVREHLQRFETAELIVFCAESPDVSTADLGISLYQSELAGREGYDLAALLPMFRILLYAVARGRREKERLYALLRAWALEDAENARLTADVVAAFRRSTCQLDLTRALTILVAIEQRFGAEVPLPFAVDEAFGATLPVGAGSGAGSGADGGAA